MNDKILENLVDALRHTFRALRRIDTVRDYLYNLDELTEYQRGQLDALNDLYKVLTEEMGV